MRMIGEKPPVEYLRDILLSNDRKTSEQLNDELTDAKQHIASLQTKLNELSQLLGEVEQNIEDADRLRIRVEPLVDEKVGEIKQNFRQIFGREMKETIKLQMEDSKDEYIDALYPMIGKIVSKYVSHQFSEMMENINKKLDSAFSLKKLKLRIKSVFSKASYEELMILDSIAQMEIKEVHIIQHHTGLLLASSIQNAVDVDMFAGMFTAIKSFAENTFAHGGSGDLEILEMGQHTVVIDDFPNYYVATVMTGGRADAHIRKKLSNHWMLFSEKYMQEKIEEVDNYLFNRLSKTLKAWTAKLQLNDIV